jgi:protein-disulfide isomerase
MHLRVHHHQDEPPPPILSNGLQSEIRVELREWRGHMGQGAELSEPVDPAHDHVRGKLEAPVTVVEYGSLGSRGESQEDRALRDGLRALLDEGRVRLIFRHFPLIDSHPGAWLGSQAVEAASHQDRFWEMHDALTDLLTQAWSRELDPASILELANELELDHARLEADMTQAAVATKILRDLHSGFRSGVNGAPTFYVEGIRQEIESPEELIGKIEHALAGDRAALWPPSHVHTVGSGPLHGHAGKQRFHLDTQEHIAHGDRLLLRGEAHGAHTGGAFRVPYLQIWEFEPGCVKRVETLTDPDTIAAVLDEARTAVAGPTPH